MREEDVAELVNRLHREFRTFRSQVQHFQEHVEEELTEIKGEAQLTNGRVRMLEIAKAYADGARHAMSWTGPLVGSVVSGVVVGIVLLVAQRFG